MQFDCPTRHAAADAQSGITGPESQYEPDWMRGSKRPRVLYTITRGSADAYRGPDRCELRAISEGTLSSIDREVPRR